MEWNRTTEVTFNHFHLRFFIDFLFLEWLEEENWSWTHRCSLSLSLWLMNLFFFLYSCQSSRFLCFQLDKRIFFNKLRLHCWIKDPCQVEGWRREYSHTLSSSLIKLRLDSGVLTWEVKHSFRNTCRSIVKGRIGPFAGAWSWIELLINITRAVKREDF